VISRGAGGVWAKVHGPMDCTELHMTDERNIAHDKKVAQDKLNKGEPVVENSSIVPQPGKEPPLIDADTGPSNSVAKEMYKHGEEPRVHRDETDDSGESDNADKTDSKTDGK